MSTRSVLLAGLAIWAVTMIWFILLTQWLSVVPGSTVAERSNTLFHSDTAHSIQRLTSEGAPEQRSFESWIHPWTLRLWRPLARISSRWLSGFMTQESASLWAAKLLVISIAALAAAGLGGWAISRGVSRRRLAIGLALYWMFSSNVIVVLPEHFGISHGLLALTFTFWQLMYGPVAMGVAIAVLGLLTLGTTLTNGAFSASLLAGLPCKSQRCEVYSAWAILALTLVLLFGAAATDFARGSLVSSVVGKDSREVSRFVDKFQNNRWQEDPLAAGSYTISAFTLPVIGPPPHLVKVYKGKFDMLSYEPLDWRDYSGLQRVGVGVWIVLLAVCVARGLRDGKSAPAVLILLAWILFNAIFHNFWGDEFFLFSPHWSWALWALVLAGFRTLPIQWLTVAVVLIGAAQAQTLWSIRMTLTTLL